MFSSWESIFGVSQQRLGCLGLWFEDSYKKKFISGCYFAAQALGENICHILPALRSLSGCDLTSRPSLKKIKFKSCTVGFCA